ncbi:MAG: hypothetical protein IJU45_00705, partial [Clostridia bacterium]|nr:hypothetical protein [Clostridia bacterium]
ISASKKHIDIFLKEKRDTFRQLGKYFQNYQIALYLYAFSSFTEVIVLENFNTQYLEKVSRRIEDFSVDYRSIYTDCYNYIEGKSEKSPQAIVLEIGSKVSKKIGESIAKTHIGEKTLIDEKIISNAEKITKVKDLSVSKYLNEFCNYKETNVQSFMQMFNVLDKMLNKNTILFDSQNPYIPKMD